MRVSLIMPAYNVAAYIAAAIRSVRAQTHADWRLIVVDDGSSDDTGAIAARAGDARVAVLRQANAGVSAARNRGIAAAEGEAMMFLDADDWLAPDALARLVAALAAAPAAVAAYGPFCFVTEDGREVVGGKTGEFAEGDILERLLLRNLFANGGHLLIRAAAVRAAGPFRADLRYGEDWEFWCRLALAGRFVGARGAAPLLYVRQREGGAMLRMARDPSAFRPCMDAIFGAPGLAARFGAARLARLRRRAEAENCWVVGRELIRHGRAAEGRHWLRRSFRGRPTPKRALLLAAAHALPLLPTRLRGPFRRYRTGLTPATEPVN